MKNIRKFETTAEMDSAVLEDVSVSYVNEENKVYTTPENGDSSDNDVDYSKEYLTFVALEDGTFSFTKNTESNVIQYSKDDGATWTSLASGETVSVVTGDKVMWKSTTTPLVNTGVGRFSSTGRFEAHGNVMSLLSGDKYTDRTDFLGKTYAFYGLFSGCTNLTTAPELPATILASNCYQYMFYNCTNLTTAPELPATTLANYCYYCMFKGCTSLTTAPELPSTTLAGSSCYSGMFQGCTNLTTAPELPATTLASNCYDEMFQGCTNLTTAPELPATELTYRCYAYMFSGCTNLTTAPELPAATLANYCYRDMFLGCTSLTTAPSILPATTLADYCYYEMFRGCTSLNHITMLATDISASNCLRFWVSNVSPTGTFVKHPDMTTLPTGSSGIPSGWTVEDAVL